MRTIRLGLLLLVGIIALPLMAQCVECNDYFDQNYVCEHSYYSAFNECFVSNNGAQCQYADPCEGTLGERCAPEDPNSCVVHRAELLDSHPVREWQLVAVKIERPRRNARS